MVIVTHEIAFAREVADRLDLHARRHRGRGRSGAAGDRQSAGSRDARLPQPFPPHRRVAAGQRSTVMPDIDRAYLVTGAASGIGRATAKLLAAPGTALLLHTRSNAEGLDATAAEAEAKGAAVGKLPRRSRRGSSRYRRRRRRATRFRTARRIDPGRRSCPPRQRDRHAGGSVPAGDGRIGAGVHAAGRRRAAAAACRARYADRGGVLFRRACDPAGIRTLCRNGGKPLRARSAGASHRDRLAEDGITVNAVSPGLIIKDKPSESRLSPEQIAATEALIPMRRRGRPEEVAEIIAFLASPKRPTSPARSGTSMEA